jgi:hypothetical protein
VRLRTVRKVPTVTEQQDPPSDLSVSSTSAPDCPGMDTHVCAQARVCVYVFILYVHTYVYKYRTKLQANGISSQRQLAVSSYSMAGDTH